MKRSSLRQHLCLARGWPLVLLLGGLLSHYGCDERIARQDANVSPQDANVSPQDANDPKQDGSDASRNDRGLAADSEAGCQDSCARDAVVADLPSSALKSSVSQHGITWTFDKAYPCGQFLTGDWWVVGPVNVVSVSPQPTATRNGSIVDPVGSQAYDSRGGRYDEAKAVSFPLMLTATHSLVSSVSHPEESACFQGGQRGWETYDGNCQRGPIATQAILTVVPQVLAPATFRPPYSGAADKPLHAASKICWKQLPKLAVPDHAPLAAAVLRHVERPWIDHLNSWTMQHGCATLNMYCYGGDIGDTVATLALYVLLDTPQQQQLAYHLIQLGIDNYGVVEAGGGWGADGGHFNGRKWPIVFAGAMLGEARMTSPGTSIGNEDQMTYVGANNKALWGRPCTSCYLANNCRYGGTCPKGSKDCRDPAKLVDGCVDYRNATTSKTWVGEALALEILGLTSAWDHVPFFDYVDRWMSGDVEGGGGTTSSFVSTMWTTYRNNLPTPQSCP